MQQQASHLLRLDVTVVLSMFLLVSESPSPSSTSEATQRRGSHAESSGVENSH